MAKIKDIADRLNISKTAVSVYLKNPSTTRVSAKTKARIDKVIKQLNYRPNVIAKSLALRKSKIIGILIPFNGPLFASSVLNEVLSGLQSVFFEFGYSMTFLPTKGENSSTMVQNQLADCVGYDGLILYGTRYCSKADMESNLLELLKTDIPFVLLGMPEFSYPVNQIITRTSDTSSATRYLVKLGHEEILIVAGSTINPESIEEIKVHKNCLKEKGIEFDERRILFGNYEREVARGAVLQFLKKEIKFSAIYCLSDTMAMGTYEALRENKIAIPGDVSIIGKNDSFFAEFLDPPLTTVRVKNFDVGVKGAEALLRTIETKLVNQKIFLDNELILRLSTSIYGRA